MGLADILSSKWKWHQTKVGDHVNDVDLISTEVPGTPDAPRWEVTPSAKE